MILSQLSQFFEQDWVQIWPVIFLIDFVRYLIAAGAVYGVLWIAMGQRLAHRRIQPGTPEFGQMAMEFRYSMLTAAVFASVGLGIYLGGQAGILKLIPEFHTGDTGYLLGSTLLMIILHDAYFYWTHRLMHHRRLFRWMHQRHHLSRRPTPWTAYSFAPAEALVQAAFAPLFMLFIPMHELGLFLWVGHQIIRNAIGHGGIEIFPRGWVGNRLLDWNNTVTHHDLHHSQFRHNYGLYFTWWDRWMGTENPNYRKKFDEVTITDPAKAIMPQAAE
ncbi:MAG: sterol desaturase family protein [Alphaproteobacteria bacterium]